MPGFWSTICGGKKKKYQEEPEVVAEQVQCTKSHEPLTTFKKMALSDDEDVKIMHNGTQLWKIKPGWQQQRLYRLESDGMTIWYQSRAKKARSKQIFSILHIESVREGRQSEGLRRNGRRFPESCCFSISFMGRRKNLDLAASSEQEAQSWIHGLQKLMERAIAMSQREKLVQIRDYLHQADRDGDEKMSFQEVKDMLRMINIDMNDIYAYTLFKKCDRSNTDRLEDHEIEEFCTQLMYRPELEEIFHQYSGEDRVLSAEELQEFLHHQGEEATLERAREIIHKYELNEKAKQHDLMMQEGFMMYLLSTEGDIFSEKHRKVYQDMNQPLSHYFISSSHNTYLTNHQLVGTSSTESYIRAFMDGCRCVELDCWEGTNGEPVIYHGHTFTSKILFKDVIATIKHYAFKYSPYPVILSIENHCGLEQQMTMAHHLRTILGDTLLTQPLGDPDPSHLPSPEAMKGKILVKGKKLSERRLAEDEEGKARMDTAQELSDLVIYCQSVEYRDQPGSVCEMSSFSEDKVRRLMKESGNQLVRYNTRQLSRIYPDALRAGSSNYSPQEMWNAGCQLVALNFQTPGHKMDLNQGRFQDNGWCGYVLKPEFLRREDTCFNPEDLSSKMKILNIKIISAQQLPKLNQENPNSIVDPFIRVEIHSLGRKREQETTYILNNGFNPTWNETLRLEVLCPDLALVRFVVEDYDKTSSNDFVGQYTVPFLSLKQGYRHVHMLSKDGASLSPATLFVHLHIEDP